MEYFYGFILGLVMFIIGFLFYYPYYIKKIKKPELGIKRKNKLDYLGDGYKTSLLSQKYSYHVNGYSYNNFHITDVFIEDF